MCESFLSVWFLSFLHVAVDDDDDDFDCQFYEFLPVQSNTSLHQDRSGYGPGPEKFVDTGHGHAC